MQITKNCNVTYVSYLISFFVCFIVAANRMDEFLCQAIDDFVKDGYQNALKNIRSYITNENIEDIINEIARKAPDMITKQIQNDVLQLNLSHIDYTWVCLKNLSSKKEILEELIYYYGDNENHPRRQRLSKSLQLLDSIKSDIPNLGPLCEALLGNEKTNLQLKSILSERLHIITEVRKFGRESGDWLKNLLNKCPLFE